MYILLNPTKEQYAQLHNSIYYREIILPPYIVNEHNIIIIPSIDIVKNIYSVIVAIYNNDYGQYIIAILFSLINERDCFVYGVNVNFIDDYADDDDIDVVVVVDEGGDIDLAIDDDIGCMDYSFESLYNNLLVVVELGQLFLLGSSTTDKNLLIVYVY